MAGREHDLAELRERRNAAVLKGLRRMYKFFKKDQYAALHEIGDDAPSIFFECWYTSANSAIRMESKDICKKLLPRYEHRLLEETGGRLPAEEPTFQAPAAARRTRMRLTQVIAEASARQQQGTKGGGGGSGEGAAASDANTAAGRGRGMLLEAARLPGEDGPGSRATWGARKVAAGSSDTGLELRRASLPG